MLRGCKFTLLLLLVLVGEKSNSKSRSKPRGRGGREVALCPEHARHDLNVVVLCANLILAVSMQYRNKAAGLSPVSAYVFESDALSPVCPNRSSERACCNCLGTGISFPAHYGAIG